MTQAPAPDQMPARWDRHVDLYQEVFEPLTDQFAARAVAVMKLAAGETLLDCAAGTGGAALMVACQGVRVTAIDAAPAMVARIASRSANERLDVEARCMDAEALDLPDRRFAAALSVFGLILCPNPVGALRELARVTQHCGRIAIVTWSEPERYELAARLMRAADEVRGGRGPALASVPPQLRFREPAAFRDLFSSAGLDLTTMERLEGRLRAPSVEWLIQHLEFAPGLADMLDRFGHERDAILTRFAADLRQDKGSGAIELSAIALLGVATVSSGD